MKGSPPLGVELHEESKRKVEEKKRRRGKEKGPSSEGIRTSVPELGRRKDEKSVEEPSPPPRLAAKQQPVKAQRKKEDPGQERTFHPLLLSSYPLILFSSYPHPSSLWCTVSLRLKILDGHIYSHPISCCLPPACPSRISRIRIERERITT